MGASPEQIQDEVGAIYQAVKNRNIAYINSILVFLPDEGLSGQRVRLPRESLSSGSANCIDGVLLLASLLEAASLNPALVFLPGHAVVAWEKARDSATWNDIETTLLGAAEVNTAARYPLATLNASVSVPAVSRAFRAVTALAVGPSL